LGGNV